MSLTRKEQEELFSTCVICCEPVEFSKNEYEEIDRYGTVHIKSDWYRHSAYHDPFWTMHPECHENRDKPIRYNIPMPFPDLGMEPIHFYKHLHRLRGR